jgi:hypothetical protein
MLQSISNFLFCALQAAAAFFQLKDRLSAQGKIWPHRHRASVIAAALVLGAVLAGVLGVWTWDHPPISKTVIETKVVETPVPCPPGKSGAASTKGTQSPAISGSGNSVDYGQPSPKK